MSAVYFQWSVYFSAFSIIVAVSSRLMNQTQLRILIILASISIIMNAMSIYYGIPL
jgi:hypothetical protein